MEKQGKGNRNHGNPSRKEESKIETTTNESKIKRKYAYEIRLRNHLDQHWAVWFEGWTITNVGNDEVILACSSTDHAGLHGALDKIRDLNLAIIYVKQIPPEPSGP